VILASFDSTDRTLGTTLVCIFPGIRIEPAQVHYFGQPPRIRVGILAPEFQQRVLSRIPHYRFMCV
jgi:hypothetical protein